MLYRFLALLPGYAILASDIAMQSSYASYVAMEVMMAEYAFCAAII
jgi:hypothetical protein